MPALAEEVTRQATPAAAPASGGAFDTNRLLTMVDAGKEPLRTFLIQHSSDSERAFFLRSVQRMLPPERRAELTPDDFIVIVPAFTVSELTAAFQIGFLLFLTFLAIDIAISAVLMGMGMMMLPPNAVSLPLKLVFFVLVDGWGLIAAALVRSYQ